MYGKIKEHLSQTLAEIREGVIITYSLFTHHYSL